MFKTLLRIHLKALFHTMFSRGNAANRANQPGKKKRRTVLITVLFLYVFAMMAFSLGSVFYTLAAEFAAAPETAWFYFALLGILILCLSFIGSVFSTKNLLFRAKDNALLLSMPIPPLQILAGRVAVLLVLEGLYTLIMAVPAAVVWFLQTGFSLPLLLRFLLCTVLLLLVSAALTGFFGWLLALMDTKFAKSDLVQMIVSLVLLIGYFLICFNMQNYLSALLARAAEISAVLRRVLPLFYLYGRGVTGSPLAILLLAVAALLPFLLVCLLLSRSFLKLSTDKKAHSRAAHGKAQTAVRSPRRALLRKELRQFFSMPLYMLNCGFGIVMELLIAALLFVKRANVLKMLAEFDNPILPVAVPLIAIGFCIATVNTPAVSLSLEGKRIDRLRAMPVQPGDVFFAKLSVNVLLALPTTLAAGILTGLAFSLPPATIALLTLAEVLTLCVTSCVHLTANILWPKFNFTNEAVLIKQSGSVLFGLLIALAVQATFLLLGIAAMLLLGILPGLAILSALLCAAGLCFLRFFRRGAVRRFTAMHA